RRVLFRSEACGTPGFRVCFDLLITILGTPEDGLAKLLTPRPPCSTTAFPGSPNGFSLHTFSEKPVRILIFVHYLGAIHSGRRGKGGGDETYHVGHDALALSVSGGQVLDTRWASGDQLQRPVPGARIVSTADGSAARHRTASRRILAGSGDGVTILKGA